MYRTKFRIVTDGKYYRTQARYWFWPFWIYIGFDSLGNHLEYAHKHTAQALIDGWIEEENKEQVKLNRKWTVVE